VQLADGLQSTGRSIESIMADLLNGVPRADPTKRPTGWRHAVLRLVATKPGSAIHRTLAAQIDAPLMRLTRGHVNTGLGAIPLVVLRTTGAKSGVQRDVPLGYFTDGDDVIVIASNYGQAKHPSWYYNLLEHPECELLTDGRRSRFIARPTEGADHDRLFALAEGYYSGYTTYAANTNGVRTIQVMRLTPEPR
jgi:deazaflavin-dependent oxidoreductase (nitroreductase family)